MTDTALNMAVMWHAVDIYSKFDRLGETAAKQAADFCQEWSNEYPLWCPDERGKRTETVFPTRDIPGCGEHSSVYAIAVQAAYLVWFVLRRAGATEKDLPTDNGFLEAALMGWRIYANLVKAP